ncbi:MAG: hypothetical protein Q9201_005639 [Fulgogasparrea decipioides]
MDIARSINFDSLQGSPPVPKKHDRIDVDCQFDVYTTRSIVYPAEAPPVYQKKEQVQDGSIGITTQLPLGHEPLTSSKSPSFVLRTIGHTSARPSTTESNRARQSAEVAQSLQLSKVELPLSNGGQLGLTSINDEHTAHTRPHQTEVLCEFTGASMDYAQPDELMPGKMGMVKGASTCAVRVASRRKQVDGGDFRIIRSIWVIADNAKTRIQQKLPHGVKIVPYTVWSSETKVVIQYPTELRHYGNATSETPHRTTKTSWVTYTFGSPSAAAEFQSALLSPLKLIETLPTSRVMRLHPSPFIRAFSPRLQLCGLENLRVFHDATDPNSLVCMIRYSPNFREMNGDEYLVFRLYPPPRNSVRIREDGDKCVKIKGLDIRGSPAGKQLKNKKGKTLASRVEQLEEEAYGSESVEKIQIEFDSGKEKRQFLNMTRELQGFSSW